MQLEGTGELKQFPKSEALLNIRCVYRVKKKQPPVLAGVAQWTECWPANQSRWFDSLSGHMPGLPARSPVGDVWEAGIH